MGLNQHSRGIVIGDPWEDTPTPSIAWIEGDGDTIIGILQEYAYDNVTVVSANKDAEVVVKIPDDWSAEVRGSYLMAQEAEWQEHIDPAITVYLQPAMDKNSLRKLRGIEVK